MDSVDRAQASADLDSSVGRDFNSANTALTFDGGSFRDRTARVLIRDGQVFRLLSDEAFRNWRRVSNEPFFRNLLQQGHIVATRELSPVEAVPFLNCARVTGVLTHERIPFVSYPFEWSFSMLREAALLHLQILWDALAGGIILKDASPYNVQFFGSRPVFIDIASFVAQGSGEPWTGYRQFCEMMLFPLLLQAYKRIDIQPILRAKIDGIRPQEFLRSMSWMDMCRKGVFAHGWLQSILDRQAKVQQNTIAELKSSGFSNQLIKNNLAGLRRLIEHLKWKPDRTVWTGYRNSQPHVTEDQNTKAEFVRRACESRRRKMVWDLGCNDGFFSRIASAHSDTVVAMDQDHGCVELLFRDLQASGPKNILPLCIDLLNPSPAQGWRGRERSRLETRGLPELTICLGLIHHLVIAGNIPLPEVVDWLASLNGEVILEFPEKGDAMVKQLLQNKHDQYSDYSLSGLETAIEQRFCIVDRTELPSGNRTLFHLVPRSSKNGDA